ncbi:leucine zipper protein 1 [Conger conger]|uniref:leucine zipper protein 1 n=1 Tax=Conger conger TaxID=82655 RepID=UPI002A5A8A51|nr:leucine zipper protein 1 [Conger conger]
MTDYKDTTNRHLRHKLQSLSRRIDELEEASNKLQKSEDELLDLQDKIFQAEGANSALLGEVDVLRRRVLKIEGKDEEVRKAEDLCRLVREKLVEEEDLTRELKADIEHLQSRMAELEKLEEAFGKSKSDCTQLCLSLNEEKNLTRKLSSELEALKARAKEVDASEGRLDRAEQALAAEMERLKALTQAFVGERKRLLEKQREDEQVIRELRDKLERNNQLTAADQSRNTSNLQGGRPPADTGDLRIEDDLPPGLSAKLALRKKSLDFLDDVVGGLRNSKSEKERKKGGMRDGRKEEEDNKVKDLTQEVERLKSRLKQLELVEEDLKRTECKNGELLERFQQERGRSRALSDQIEQLKMQLGIGGGIGGGGGGKILENGKAENEEINVRGGFRQEKPKYRSGAAEPAGSKHKARDLSPTLQRKETKLRSKELSQSEESSPKMSRRALSPVHKSRRGPKSGMEAKEKMASAGDGKKPSVLSRYPPAANDPKPWKAPAGLMTSAALKPAKVSQLYAGSDSESNSSDVLAEHPGKSGGGLGGVSLPETNQEIQDPLAAEGHPNKANGSYMAYKSQVSSHLTPADLGSEGHSSASETESTGSRRSAGDPEPLASQEGTGSARPAAASAKHSRYSRLQDSNSEGSSPRSSFDEERTLVTTEGGSSSEATPTHTPSGIEIRRVCSPREALRSKAVIKPAIVEIDRKEVMSSGGASEPLAANGKPRISTKPASLTCTSTGKMTSSITIYPNDPGSSRTSSRSSSVSSEPPSSASRERHTSTSNIIITPGDHHRSTVSIPYEISIPKAEITLREHDNEEEGDDDDDSNVATETSRVETQLVSRSSLTLRSPSDAAATPDLNNDTESGFESGSSSTTTVASWRSHRNQPSSSSRDYGLPDMRNVTVRSTLRTRGGAVSVDEAATGRSKVADGSEDEAENSATTWRAYRATTVLDAEETPAAATVAVATRAGKPSPAEVYMQRINSAAGAREPPEPVRRTKSAISPSEGFRRSVPHEPVTAQELQPWNRPQPTALEETTEAPNSSWRKQSSMDQGSYDRTASKRTGARPDMWAGQGGVRGQTGRNEGRSGGSRPWSSPHTEI